MRTLGLAGVFDGVERVLFAGFVDAVLRTLLACFEAGYLLLPGDGPKAQISHDGQPDEKLAERKPHRQSAVVCELSLLEEDDQQTCGPAQRGADRQEAGPAGEELVLGWVPEDAQRQRHRPGDVERDAEQESKPTDVPE